MGNLSPKDAKKAQDFQFGKTFKTDPFGDPYNLLCCTKKLWRGEPRIDLPIRDHNTPNELYMCAISWQSPTLIPKCMC
jgi:hypothetical protein